MKPSKAMKEAILKVFPEFKPEEGWHAKMESEGYMPLCVEVIEPNVVSIAHYYEQNFDLVPDPDVLFWMDPIGGDWFPVSIKTVYGINRVANVQPDFKSVSSRTPAKQHDLTNFCELWAKNLLSQFR